MLSIQSSFRVSRIASQCMMSTYTHDLAVIGGGSGGLAAAKAAARLGAKVVLFDHVAPSVTRGTTWGFAGTCVNVGCIPKKLFHYSSLLGESIPDLAHLGFPEVHKAPHDWGKMVTTVTNFIRKLNFSYRTGARSAGVEYVNAHASFINPLTDEHALKYALKEKEYEIRAKKVILAVGSRPAFPKMEGSELAITSDDIFWQKSAPGRTLVVGGGYIAMECAGFLTGLGYPTTVAVRSRPLRAFDDQIADKIVSIMNEKGTKFITCTPRKLEKNGSEIRVFFDNDKQEIFDTVLIATGRAPSTQEFPSQWKEKSGKLVADPKTCLVEKTDSIYAIGDCLSNSPELTPVAVRDGEMLAARLFGGSTKTFDKRFIPTTVFTPSEYGSVGLSEQQANDQFGGQVECYLYEWPSLERAALHREKVTRESPEDIEEGNNCFCKLVVHNDLVVGFHFLGPNAGEVTQGFALAVKLGAKKSDFDDLVGIHPTDAEAFCELNITKSSGDSFVAAGGCGGGKCG